jgi:uncharacterized protein
MNYATRWGLILLGHACVVLGTLGIFLPLLPTTPFILLAAACYVRSSERHYQWIMENRIFGKILRDYQQKRGITFWTKVIALALLWTSLLFSVSRVDKPTLRWVILCAGIFPTALILRIPTLRDEDP